MLNSSLKKKTDFLRQFVPEKSGLLLLSQLSVFPGKIRIAKPRKTKLGDFRAGKIPAQTKISVNSDLNQFAFLITLLHEVAH